MSIYKYCNFNQKYSLENFKQGVEYLESVDCFNDPYDSYFFVDQNKLKPFYSKKIRGHINGVYEDIKHSMQKYTIVSCFSASEITTNILMWSHYAHNHEGFCIEYDMNDLISFISKENRVKIFPIVYSNKMPDLTELLVKYLSTGEIDGKMFKTVIMKMKQWEYEKEWRLISGADIVEPKERLISMPKPKAIYLGVKIKKENETEIKQVAQKKGIAIFKMDSPTGDEYKLQVKRSL